MHASTGLTLALLLLLTAPGCPSRPEIHAGGGEQTVADRDSGPEARAFRVKREDHLLTGRAAQGRAGDWRLENRDVAVIVSHHDRPLGFGRSGGNVIDAGTRERNTDALGQLILWLDETWPRQAIYTAVRVTAEGGPGATAALEASGHDSDDPALKITTRYTLPPTGRALTVETRIENTGATSYTDFELGDALQWGNAQRFAPGHGFNLSREPIMTAWLAGEAPEAAYGWVSEASAMRSIHGSGWSDATVKVAQLPPGASATYTRHLIIGDGAIGDLLPDIFAQLKLEAHAVQGRVAEEGTEAPIADATILVARDGESEPFARIRSGADGAFQLHLPPGAWLLRAEAPGRRAHEPRRVTSPPAQDPLIHLSGAGRLAFTLTSGGAATSGKVIVRGVAPTPNPVFGPEGATVTGTMDRVYTLTGVGEVALPPGRYTVFGARGPEYGLAKQEITVAAGETARAALEVKRVVDTTGWIAGDFHQHSDPSGDSSVALEDRVISNLVEGVELLVSTDHNHITDFAPVIEKMGVRAQLASMVGNEITTSTVGHFNAYPLIANPSAVAGGAFGPKGMTPAEIFARLRSTPPDNTIIQINHPRAGRIGFLDAMAVEPGTLQTEQPGMSWDFDAVEVVNGKRLDHAQPVLDDWFAMLNRGGLFVAMGNSDTHAVIDEEPGYARTLIQIGEDAPGKITTDAVVAAIRGRRAVVTTGPFVTATLAGVPIGGFVAPQAGGRADLKVKVQAPPWIGVARVELIERGEVVHTWDEVKGRDEVVRLEATHAVSIAKPTWFIVRVIGEGDMEPVVSGTTPYAFTNPIWVGEEAR